MKKQDFIKAVEILTEHHSNEIIINHVKPNGQVSPVLESPTIHIKNCVPSVVNKLIASGYSLGMHEGMMTVDKF